MKERVKIWVATHRSAEKFGDACYQFLHVGAEQHSEVKIEGAVRDNAGEDHISHKNDIYCELSGLYYVWKNRRDVDIIGLVHYRRFFVRQAKRTKTPNDIILTQAEIEACLKEHDVILGTPGKKLYAVGGYFTNPLDVPEFAIYRNILPSLKALYPEYADSYKEEFFRPAMSFCNMMICRQDLFDRYCEFLFSVLFDAEKRWNDAGIGVAPREMGYISEYLLNCWVRHNKLKVCHKPIMLFEDTNKLGFKVHYLLEKIGLKFLSPLADKLYSSFFKKKIN